MNSPHTARKAGKCQLAWSGFALPRWLWSVLLIAAILRLIGLGWGLPSTDGWDSDGIAPRDFLAGIVLTYKSGSYYTYPPLHLMLLAALTAPGWLIGLCEAPTLGQADLINEFIKVPYMTFFAWVARLVSVTMSVGTVYCVARMARLVDGELASAIAALIAALNAVLIYYGHTTNLDGPYLFWSVLAMLFVMEGIAGRRPYRIAIGVLFFIAAVATKDQAYALALLSFPVVIICWGACDDWARKNWLAIAKPVMSALLIGTIAFSIVSGAVFNPTGFASRMAFLTGTASADNAYYTRNLDGLLRILWDGLTNLENPYPIIFVGLGIYGILLHGSRARKNHPVWVAGLLPLLAMVSFTVCFNFVALRTDDRFLLPHSLLLAIYIGIGGAHLLTTGSRLWRRTAATTLALAFVLALYRAAAVDAAFLYDPRYDAERWLVQNFAPGTTIETYGKNVYLPRFPAKMRVTRVGPDAVAERSPLASATEINQPYDQLESRHPEVLVISAFWVGRYLAAENNAGGYGRDHSTLQRELFMETDSRKFFSELMNERRNYCITHVSKFNSSVWKEVHIHQSLNESVVILKRDEARCPSPPS